MNHYYQDDFDYLVDDYEMADFDDDAEEDGRSRLRTDVGSDSENEFDSVSSYLGRCISKQNTGCSFKVF